MNNTDQQARALPEHGSPIEQLRDVRTLFVLVLLGELIAVVLVLARSGLAHFDMSAFGLISFQILWVILGSVVLILSVRGYLQRQSIVRALVFCYVVILLMALLTSILGQFLLTDQRQLDRASMLNSVLIAAIFAGIFLRYMYLQLQLQQQRHAELKARLSALQARIRPHFLFNSLNTIASLIPVDARAAEKMIVDLSHLFRASIQHSDLLALEEELHLCRRYLAIESLRFGDRLNVCWQVEIADHDARIPALLVQPLLENGIVHGIQKLTGGGQLNIVVTAKHGSVDIVVSNPVPPVAQREREKGRHNGIALENIRHRLQAHFGSSAQLTAALDDEQQCFTVRLHYSHRTAI